MYVWSSISIPLHIQWISNSSKTICWKGCSFPIVLSWHLCWKQISYKCEGLFLDSDFILWICLSIFMLISYCLDYCSFVASLLWVLWLCSSFSRLYWLFRVPWISIWILGCFSQFWKEETLRRNRNEIKLHIDLNSIVIWTLFSILIFIHGLFSNYLGPL